jgi:DNA-binding SARP family transcriptional activator
MVLQLDPYREIAYQQLMLAQAASGNRGSALLPCARCRRLLGGELGTTRARPCRPCTRTCSGHADAAAAPRPAQQHPARYPSDC